jgi:sec-independent protein translocase protein TatC
VATLLGRVLQRAPRKPVAVEDDRMSVIEHLEALRRVLIVSLIAWAAATTGSFFFSGRVIDFLLNHANLHNAVYFAPGGGILNELKVAMYMGVIIAGPVVIQQFWWFISPGLHEHERRFILPLIVATIFFFALGVAVAIYAMPLYIAVLGRFAPQGVAYLPDLSQFLSFVLLMVIGFGFVFELPVVLFVLGMLRIVNTRWLYKRRPYFFLALGLVANFLTPGADPLTPMIMFIPLYLFFEGTTLLLKILGR